MSGDGGEKEKGESELESEGAAILQFPNLQDASLDAGPKGEASWKTPEEYFRQVERMTVLRRKREELDRSRRNAAVLSQYRITQPPKKEDPK